MNKHTIGPWHVGYDTCNDRALCVAGPNCMETHTCVCKVAPGDNINDEDRANAKLIAAAPELLAALKTAIKVMQDQNLDEALAGEFELFTDAVNKATQ